MCADTVTSNYHWVKPAISGSPTTWGVKWNADLDLIDNTVFANDAAQTAAIAAAVAAGSAALTAAINANNFVGEIKMYAGVSAPAGWKFCDGAIYLNTDIPLLAPILNNAFGGTPGTSNAVPDLRDAFPTGADGTAIPLGSTGGEDTHVLTIAEMPSHDHPIFVTDPTHNHGLGVQVYGLATGTNNITAFSGSGSSTSTSNNSTGITVDIGDTGGGVEFTNIPPYLALNFIIKFQ